MEGSSTGSSFTTLIDFGQLASDLMPVVTDGITAAVIIGGSVLAAKLVWSFFRSFVRG